MTTPRLNADATQQDGHEERAIIPASSAPLAPVERRDLALAGQGEELRRSRLLDYLPAIFADDDFSARFVRIFEDILDPIEQLVQNLPYYFDPPTAPPALVEWLAEWVDLHEGAGWPARQRQALISQAVPIYGSRGTARSLKLHLQALCGTEPLITENSNGFRLGADARLGYNTLLGHERPGAFTVTVVVPDPAALDPDLVHTAIETEKPLGTQAIVRFAPQHKLPDQPGLRARRDGA
jgi:phage tail-like protein